MGFDEFLKKAGLTEDAFKKLTPAEQEYIHASYYVTTQNAAMAEEKSKQESEERAKAQAYSIEEAVRQRRQDFYDKWSEHFAKYGGNLAQDNYKEISKMLGDRQQRITNERKVQAITMARRSCKGHPEKLLFAEANAMDTSLKLESWERLIPVGNKFAHAFDYAKSQRADGEKLSDTMQRLDPSDVDYAMYSRLLKRYDDDPSVLSMDTHDLVRDMFKNSPESLNFYKEHFPDNKKYGNPENLDFTMKEMFRLGKRMSRNSRMSPPMKELCAKLNSLEKDYTADPDKYKMMPRSRLNHLMKSISFAADAYINDKKNLKSFSSTQLERLKCINQIKSLQEALTFNADKKEYCFGNAGQYMDGFYSYNENALAEKLVLNHQIQSRDGAALCDREKMQDLVQNVLDSDTFKKFKEMTISTVRKSQGEAYPVEAIHDKLLKSNGQELLKNYQSFSQKLFREEADALFAPHNKPAVPTANAAKNNAVQNNNPAKNQGGFGMK